MQSVITLSPPSPLTGASFRGRCIPKFRFSPRGAIISPRGSSTSFAPENSCPIQQLCTESALGWLGTVWALILGSGVGEKFIMYSRLFIVQSTLDHPLLSLSAIKTIGTDFPKVSISLFTASFDYSQLWIIRQHCLVLIVAINRELTVQVLSLCIFCAVCIFGIPSRTH